MLLLSNQVIAISKAVQKELKDVYSTKSTFIYLGSNLKPANLTGDQLPATSYRRPVTILSISRFTPYKGFHKILEIAKLLRRNGLKVNVVIAGSFAKKNYLDYLKTIKDSRDKILTNVDDKKLASLYKNSDIYVSCDRYLFFGLPIAEAAYFAKPAIALDFAAAKELITHKKSGFVAQSTEELYKYLKILVCNSRLRHKMGIWAMKNARKQFDWTQITLLYKQIFTEILNK